MMNWIYPHTFGSMALYREKKPEFTKAEKDCFKDNPLRFAKIKIAWQQSFIAYLKEQEFKAEDNIYWVDEDGKLQSGKVQEIREGYIILKDGRGIGNEDNIDYSHYYPGQQEESFKYVREIKYTQFDPIIPYVKREEWQEVEEREAHSYSAFDMSKKAIEYENKVSQFQADKESGKILAIITN